MGHQAALSFSLRPDALPALFAFINTFIKGLISSFLASIVFSLSRGLYTQVPEEEKGGYEKVSTRIKRSQHCIIF